MLFELLQGGDTAAMFLAWLSPKKLPAIGVLT